MLPHMELSSLGIVTRRRSGKVGKSGKDQRLLETELSEALKLPNEAGECGLSLSTNTCSSVASHFNIAGDTNKARQALEHMVRFGWDAHCH
ncbi:hypothetical protein J1N35_021429 [Gossypium stocksii]|uniref:Uncharacterized protein n=1 Tax=Gossypium stocksii TaxID=47602 RepID=A0A9D4A1A9_9ROSI|nr:hypothetical protein J1N35_021429 [Gossypium stocksii]